MALWSRVRVNADAVGVVYVQRLKPLGRPAPGETCRYEWTVIDTSGGPDASARRATGQLERPFGDWLGLYAAVCAAAAQELAD